MNYENQAHSSLQAILETCLWLAPNVSNRGKVEQWLGELKGQ
jgi:hypothetical protein